MGSAGRENQEEEENNNGENNQNPGEDQNQDENQNGDIANGNNMLSGSAWFDANADGRKDANEQVLSGITVKLLNVNTNQLVKDSSGNTAEITRTITKEDKIAPTITLEGNKTITLYLGNTWKVEES